MDRIPLLPLLAGIELATGAFGLVSLRVFDAVGSLVLGASLAVTAAASLALVDGRRRAGRPDRQLEPCPEIVARTAGVEPITDDNMGSE